MHSLGKMNRNKAWHWKKNLKTLEHIIDHSIKDASFFHLSFKNKATKSFLLERKNHWGKREKLAYFGSWIWNGIMLPSYQCTVVWWIECSALDTEFAGSNPRHRKHAFLLHFFLPISYSLFSSRRFFSVGSVFRVVPLWGAILPWDQLPALEKKL